MSKVIVLATSKGGAGKTTLARSLACHWHVLGGNVALIDGDPQGSIIQRHDFDGPIKGIKVVHCPDESISDCIDDLRSGFRTILVDTAGFRNKTTIMALVSSDLVIIPFKPSSDDVDRGIEMLNLVGEINQTEEREKNPIKVGMVMTMSNKGTVISRQLLEELRNNNFPVFLTEITNRIVYPESAISGLSPVITDSDGAAAREISSLAIEINNKFK